jgi:DNA repair protein RadA/Sms
VAFGEIGLSGEVRSVSKMETRVNEAARLGFTKILLPARSLSKGMRAPSRVELVGVSHIREILPHLLQK